MTKLKCLTNFSLGFFFIFEKIIIKKIPFVFVRLEFRVNGKMQQFQFQLDSVTNLVNNITSHSEQKQKHLLQSI